MPATRYQLADTCGVVIERKSLKPRIYPATGDGLLTGKPVFLSDQRWEQLKNDQRSTVSAQLLLASARSIQVGCSSLSLGSHSAPSLERFRERVVRIKRQIGVERP
jgi:hypothetical protein